MERGEGGRREMCGGEERRVIESGPTSFTPFLICEFWRTAIIYPRKGIGLSGKSYRWTGGGNSDGRPSATHAYAHDRSSEGNCEFNGGQSSAGSCALCR